MHRLLYMTLRILSAWPVLAGLAAGIAFLHWLGSGVREREARVAALLEESVRIQQEHDKLEDQLNGLTLSDLRRRSRLFAEDFLPMSSRAEESIRADLHAAFEVAEWDLGAVTVEESIEADPRLPVGAVSALLSARMQTAPDEEAAPRLPVKAAVGLSHYIWRAPPFKEIESIRLERTIDGYEMSMGVFLPCRPDLTVADTTLEDLPDAEHVQ
ncbi:MAG: hypothetical protein ACPGGJ_00020 [Coraliomargarita sp.]